MMGPFIKIVNQECEQVYGGGGGKMSPFDTPGTFLAA